MNKSPLHKVYVCVFVCVFVIVSCSKPTVPKPYGYFRLHLPEQSYTTGETPHASFALNQAAEIIYTDSTTTQFFNIHYPSLNATIHCTYMPVKRNLPELLNDAQEMVYSHTIKASAIPEQEYQDYAHHIYGVFYQLQGNTATPAQFFLTDSIHHFFRASVYINTIPNQDSLAPVIDYLVDDTRHMIETFTWKE